MVAKWYNSGITREERKNEMNALHIEVKNANSKLAVKNAPLLKGKNVEYIKADGSISTAIVTSVSGETAMLSNGDWCYVWQMTQAY
jgi:hypothetical protein